MAFSKNIDHLMWLLFLVRVFDAEISLEFPASRIVNVGLSFDHF